MDMDKKEDIELNLPISHWLALCENNIYRFAKQQMNQSGIPFDLQAIVIKCVLSKFQEDMVNILINQNAELILSGKEVDKNADSDG